MPSERLDRMLTKHPFLASIAIIAGTYAIMNLAYRALIEWWVMPLLRQ